MNSYRYDDINVVDEVVYEVGGRLVGDTIF